MTETTPPNDSVSPKWDITAVSDAIANAIRDNSEVDFLKILKDNSFLFYELFSRKYSALPIFREVSFGGKFKCDFLWLNDNSTSPEWVLVEIEKPKMRLFNQDGTPASELNKAIEQVTSWERYFEQHPAEKQRIFGAVGSFKFILVAGSMEDWSKDDAVQWRNHHNKTSKIEIRTFDVFNRALSFFEQKPTEFWSFEDNPTTLEPSKLEDFWTNYSYMDRFRRIF